MSLSLDFDYQENPNRTQYVGESTFNNTPRYILGEIDNKTYSATLRVNYNINPNLTIQYYGQPFIFKAKYSNFNFVKDGIAKDLNDRVEWYGNDRVTLQTDINSYLIDEDRDGEIDYSFGNPDFTFVQYRSNLVVRWEYIPGSEIFLVWSQGITSFREDAENGFNTIVDTQLLNQKPQNTFLIKATYRFVL